MASIQEPEVQFAQRLASNEKPTRTKAVKKLRKYINVRSQKATGGFTGDELLKLWKGLFYCLWMQDKPLVQEELSNQISTLIHSFHDINGQLLYLESFLQTFKREWTGIDRLRMDKFFQLVRFMFRQTFELLKRKNWDVSVVGQFLELLTAQLLQSSSTAPSGLQFHILDLYMTELAAVGSAELTAEQNLIFIEPFCKTAAKTKDRVLFRAICSSIFSTIIDQAPFAIEDLMREIKTHEDSDSDSEQASEEDEASEEEEDRLKEKNSKTRSKKGQQLNGCKSKDDNDEDQDDDFGDWKDTELPHDVDVGPVLQFDYSVLADKLLELASRSSTPSHNRQKLYRIIKVLRDLSEGIFPQDEYPEEVSTDEDDDMFGSRKMMKSATADREEEEEGAPAAKKRKGKKKTSTLSKQNCDFGKDDLSTNDEMKEKKKGRKKKKMGQKQCAGEEKNAETSEKTIAQVQSTVTKTEGDLTLECLSEDLVKEAQSQSSVSSLKVIAATTPHSQPETLHYSELKKQASVTEETSQSLKSFIPVNKHQFESSARKKKKKSTSEPEVTPLTGEEQQTPTIADPEMSSAADASVSAKKKKRRTLKAALQTDAEAQITPVSCAASQEKNATTTPARGKKGPKAVRKPRGRESDSLGSEDDVSSIHCKVLAEGGKIIRLDKLTSAGSSVKKKVKKKSLKVDEIHKVVEERKLNAAKIICKATQYPTTVPLNEKKKGRQNKMKTDQTSEDMSPAADDTSTPLKKKKKKTNQKDSKVTVGEEQASTPAGVDAEKLLFEITKTAPAKKKKSSKGREIIDETQLQVVSRADGELLLDELDGVPSSKKTCKKKRKIPVVFEYDAAEKETDAKKTKLGNDIGKTSTTLSTKKSQKKAKPASSSAADFIIFQSSAAIPTPLFCKTKGNPSILESSKKKCQTLKSDSKKVTFGLKNNKTAEFRKTDRSLLVSPDGSSRVPFDPKQKPKFGVLKTPLTPFSIRKTSSNTPKSTPKRRPSAADFF